MYIERERERVPFLLLHGSFLEVLVWYNYTGSSLNKAILGTLVRSPNSYDTLIQGTLELR